MTWGTAAIASIAKHQPVTVHPDRQAAEWACRSWPSVRGWPVRVLAAAGCIRTRPGHDGDAPTALDIASMVSLSFPWRR